MLGLISYLFYTYAFYLFGAAFNDMFLLYMAIYATSFFAIIKSLISFPVKNIIATSKILRGISVFLILISVMLCVVEVPPCFTFITKGTLPKIILKSQIPTSIVYALDLSFVVPVMFLAAVLLWQNNNWGMVLSAIMLVKCFTYGLVLTIGTILIMENGMGYDPLLLVWIFITMGGSLGGFILLKNVKNIPLTTSPKNL